MNGIKLGTKKKSVRYYTKVDCLKMTQSELFGLYAVAQLDSVPHPEKAHYQMVYMMFTGKDSVEIAREIEQMKIPK